MALNYERVLVAIDGSKGSDVALETAIDVTKKKWSSLDILRVLDLNSLEYGGAGIALDGEQIYRIEQENEAYLLKLREELIEKHGFKTDQVNVHIRFGNPKIVITEEFQPEYNTRHDHRWFNWQELLAPHRDWFCCFSCDPSS